MFTQLLTDENGIFSVIRFRIYMRQRVLLHDYSTITRVKYALFWPHFRLFSTVIMLELCLSFSSIYDAVLL